MQSWQVRNTGGMSKNSSKLKEKKRLEIVMCKSLLIVQYRQFTVNFPGMVLDHWIQLWRMKIQREGRTTSLSAFLKKTRSKKRLIRHSLAKLKKCYYLVLKQQVSVMGQECFHVLSISSWQHDLYPTCIFNVHEHQIGSKKQ